MFEFIDYFSLRSYRIIVAVFVVLFIVIVMRLIFAERRLILFPILIFISYFAFDFLRLLPLLQISSEDAITSDRGLRESYRAYDPEEILHQIEKTKDPKIKFGLSVLFVVNYRVGNVTSLPDVSLSPPRYINDNRILNKISNRLDYPASFQDINDFFDKTDDAFLQARIVK